MHHGKNIPYWQGNAITVNSDKYNKNWIGAKVAYLKAGKSIT